MLILYNVNTVSFQDTVPFQDTVSFQDTVYFKYGDEK